MNELIIGNWILTITIEPDGRLVSRVSETNGRIAVVNGKPEVRNQHHGVLACDAGIRIESCKMQIRCWLYAFSTELAEKSSDFIALWLASGFKSQQEIKKDDNNSGLN